MEKGYHPTCVDNEIQNRIGKPMGCVPPWMSPKNQCNQTYAGFINRIPGFKEFEFLEDYIRTVITLRNNPIEDKCRKFCSNTQSTVSFRKEEDERKKKQAQVALLFKPEVEYLEIVYSYTLFNFIIDVGSSLGLWLGLSVLSLTDIASSICTFIMGKKIFKIRS